MPSEQKPSESALALIGWWVAIVAVLTAGYFLAVAFILEDHGGWVVTIGVAFSVARLLACEVGRRYPPRAEGAAERKRARVTYWLCALGGFVVFGGLWLASSMTGSAGLVLLIGGAACGLVLNALALRTAFRARIQDFAFNRQ
jgi:hypothetical protein